MKISKIMFGMIAVVAIGMFALPGSLSLGDGQHRFRQIDPTNESTEWAFCARCHSDTGDSIQQQLNASDKTLYYTSSVQENGALALGNGSTIHHDQTCASCHMLSKGYGGATMTVNGTTVTSDKSEHAAVIPSCLDCHGSGAGADTNDVTLELGSNTEAHNPFWTASNASADNDTACVGCHTDVYKSGSPTYVYNITKPETLYGVTIGNAT